MIATTINAAIKISGRTDRGFRCGGVATDGRGDDVWTAGGMDRVNCPHILEFLLGAANLFQLSTATGE